MILLLGLILSLAAAVIPTVIYTCLVWWCDRYEREPWPLLGAAFLWGAIPAVLFSLFAEIILDIPLGTLRSSSLQDLVSSGAVAPIVEEVCKGAALFGLFLLAYREFDGVLDGIIYGALVGFGFAMTENFFYFMSSLMENGWGAWASVVFLRGIIFGFNHAFFTSLTGIGLGIARLNRGVVRWLAPFVGLGMAIIFHAIHNVGASLTDVTPLSLLLSLVTDWGGVWIIVVVIWLSWRHERGLMRDYLADEGIPPADVQAAIAGRLWQRVPVAAQIQARRRADSREYQQALVELALRKYQLQQVGDEPHLRAEIERLRARVREIA
jgi:RsiW-degrading membrane proteinase PrsW (M82 family)